MAHMTSASLPGQLGHVTLPVPAQHSSQELGWGRTDVGVNPSFRCLAVCLSLTLLNRSFLICPHSPFSGQALLHGGPTSLSFPLGPGFSHSFSPSPTLSCLLCVWLPVYVVGHFLILDEGCKSRRGSWLGPGGGGVEGSGSSRDLTSYLRGNQIFCTMEITSYWGILSTLLC